MFGVVEKARLAGASFVVAGLLTANPAYAAASPDIVAPLRAAQASESTSTSSTQEQFHRLFANWQQIEKSRSLVAVTELNKLNGASGVTGGPSFAQNSFERAVSSVSIPSRVPVDGAHLTSPFGMREHPISGGMRFHEGVDLAAPVGTPIHATADGVVSRADWFSGYGLYVAIEHGGNMETRYGHMSRLNVSAGQQVHRGDVIGFVGTTGHSTGPHLHYEVRIAGEPVNPMPYMANALP